MVPSLGTRARDREERRTMTTRRRVVPPSESKERAAHAPPRPHGGPLTPEDIDGIAAITDPSSEPRDHAGVSRAVGRDSGAPRPGGQLVHVRNLGVQTGWGAPSAGRYFERALEDAIRSRSAADVPWTRRRPRPDVSGHAWAHRHLRVGVGHPRPVGGVRSGERGRGTRQPLRCSRRSVASLRGSMSNVVRPRTWTEMWRHASSKGSGRASRRPGQRSLRQAFTHYLQARSVADPVSRAQLVLLANLEIGLHQQVRLQPEIVAALDAAVVDPRDIRDR